MTFLFRVLGVLPLALLHGIGFVLGWLAFLLSATYRSRFVANARQAGYSLRDLWGAVGAAGQLVAEVPRLWFGAGARIEWAGAHLVEQALAGKRGIVFLTPHLGCFEAAAQAYAGRFGRVTVLYRPARKAWLRPLVDTARARHNLATAPTTTAGVKQLLKALQAGEAVALLPDQVPPQGLGAWAPFFGQPAYTSTLPARLARHAGACVLLTWGERLSWGRGYRIHVRPWTAALAESPQDGAAQVNAHMEDLIRECPSQYLWGYARYKQPREMR